MNAIGFIPLLTLAGISVPTVIFTVVASRKAVRIERAAGRALGAITPPARKTGGGR